MHRDKTTLSTHQLDDAYAIVSTRRLHAIDMSLSRNYKVIATIAQRLESKRILQTYFFTS